MKTESLSLKGILFSLVILASLLCFFARGHAQSTWSFVTIPDLPSGASLQTLWTDQPGNLYVWAENGAGAFLYHWDGTSWSRVLDLPAHTVGMDRGYLFGTGPSDVFASARSPAEDKIKMYHYNGISWTEQPLPANCQHVRDIAGEPGNVYTTLYWCPAPYRKRTIRYNGTGWEVVFSGDTGLNPAYISQNEIYFTDCWGHLLWSGNTWTWYSGFDFCDVREAWGMRDDEDTLHLYTVGENNFRNGVRVWKFTENYPGSMTGSWGSKYGTVFSDPPDYGSRGAGGADGGIWGSGPNDIYVAGFRDDQDPAKNGRVYHFDGIEWKRITAFGDIPYAGDVWGTGPDDVWVSLDDGRLLHYGPATTNEPPVADPGGPYTGNEGSPVTFVGTGSWDPDGDLLTYNWTFGDTNTGTGDMPEHIYTDNGTYEVCLTVTDIDGLTDTQCTTAEIANVAPAVAIGTVTQPNSDFILPNDVLGFSGSFTDPGTVDTHTFEWDFGDGKTEAGTLTPAHTYSDPETYNVTLTVTDDDSGVGSDSVTIVVETPTGATEIVNGIIEEIVADNPPGTPLGDKAEDCQNIVQTGLDELAKTPPDNQAAVGNFESAVGEIEAAVKDGLLDPTQGTQLMDQLAGIARQLAADAVEKAIAQGGDEVVIADAQQYLAAGDTLRASEDYKDAVNKYKDALAKAESVLL